MSGWDLKSDILYAGNRCHVCKRPPWVLASTLSLELCKKPLSHLHLALVYRDCIVSERKYDIPDMHHTATRLSGMQMPSSGFLSIMGLCKVLSG